MQSLNNFQVRLIHSAKTVYTLPPFAKHIYYSVYESGS